MDNKFIFRSNGFYLGFIKNDLIFSRDGLYLGWLEGDIAWDNNGVFRGVLVEKNGNNYILRNRFKLSPVQRTPKPIPSPEIPPQPPSNIPPISVPAEYIDAY